MKKFKNIFIGLFFFFCVFLSSINCGCWWFSGSDRYELQTNAAEKWLIAMDHKKYTQCYAGTSQEYKNSKTLNAFLLHCKKDRANYGLVKARTLVEVKDIADKQGNNYTLVKFKTFFTKDNAFEVVYLSQGKNNNYQVAKYYIIGF